MSVVYFAHEAGVAFSKTLVREEQKCLGQFMTPPAIATVMARRACNGVDADTIRILEPAAGAGILAAAVVEELLTRDCRPTKLEIVLCEIDTRLKPILRSVTERLQRFAASVGVRANIRICIGDFLLSDLADESPAFDIVIANPPYFKLAKADSRSRRHSYAVYGQPNIYGLFMAACARLLRPNGRWCFITPRSWTNGAYFAAVRRQMLCWLNIDAIHVFESRQEHFTDDDILQEAMITWATARAHQWGRILVSASEGVSDLADASIRSFPSQDVIGRDAASTIAVPISTECSGFRNFSATLSAFGLKVSTGPVVAFRASKYLSESASPNTVPLIWMQHIQHMRLAWPIQKKREHIGTNANNAWMFVPNDNMVLMRRFSPKEDQRRITAAPYLAGMFPGTVLGLENHTNYIYRPGAQLASEETKGLAVYLNSRLVDRYLRAVAGNTQINAADLRSLPLPSLQEIIEIGQRCPSVCSLDDVDRIVDDVLDTSVAPKSTAQTA